tara:strand:+ start:1795 stop:3978 length:2184 start_codon:yes stop_codon:yes gene_type:complete
MKNTHLLFLFCLIVFTNVNAQINIQLPETFNIYQIPKSLKGENIVAKANINYTNNTSHITEFSKLKLGTMRFPGGSFANCYDWKKALNDPTKMNFKNAIAFSKLTGIEINYMLNYGTITAHEAAELVRICNSPDTFYQNKRNVFFGATSPINIKKWEIGNELAAKWEWHLSWLAGGLHTRIYYQTGDSLYLPRTITDSLHYFGGEIWRKGWVPMAGEGMNILNSNLGTIKKITSNTIDTSIVKVKFGPIHQDSVIVWVVDTPLNESYVSSLTQQQFYDLITQPEYLLPKNNYDILGDSALIIYPPSPLNSNNLILVEYKTKHPGAFEIRDSMMFADPNIEIGYCIDFRANLLESPLFKTRLKQSPPRFLVSHPYNSGTDAILSNGSYSEIIYLAEKKAKKEFVENQKELDSITNALGISNRIGVGLTEWNIRLCGDGGCDPSYNGVLGGLYTANFLAQFYESNQYDLVDLRVSNHYAGVAEGNNLIHTFHYKPSLGSILTTPQSHAMRIVNSAIGENLIYQDTALITGNPSISILDEVSPNVFHNINSKAVKVFQSIDSASNTFNILLLNQDDERNYTVTVNTPLSFQSDTVFIEELSGNIDTSSYYITTDTILINNNQFTVNIDSFSLVSLKVNFTKSAASTPHKIVEDSWFNLYPNPTTDKIYVKSSSSKPYSIKVNSITGEFIKSTSFVTGNFSFSTQFFQPGVYLVTFFSHKGLIESKTIIVK